MKYWRWSQTVVGLCLFGALAAPAFAQSPTPTPSADPHQMPAGEGDYPRLHFAGFGDIDFAAQPRSQGTRAFSLGQFVAHITSQLSARVTVLSEISFTARTDAGTGTPPAPGFNTEIERLIVRFDQSDFFRVSFGRYHTPINYWNTAFHHGQWLQTTISRPEMIQFGGKFLPVHFVGGLVEGAVPAGGWNVGYKAGVGNGRGAVISRAGDAGDSNDNLSFLANVSSKPDRIYGLETGAAIYTDTIVPALGGQVGERIVSGYVAYQKETPEVIAEYAGVRHEQDGVAAPFWNHAYYVQLAYRLPDPLRQWKPYYRFEHIDIASGDVVFSTVLPLDGSTLGVRFDASTFVAIKAEYRNWTRGAGTPRNQGGFFQLAFTF